MTKYTTTTLIEMLKKFPSDLPIETDLAFMWNYPKELSFKNINPNHLEEYTMENAINLCIFEGDWETNISNIDGKYEEFRYCDDD